jgi:hypothetical protein
MITVCFPGSLFLVNMAVGDPDTFSIYSEEFNKLYEENIISLVS